MKTGKANKQIEIVIALVEIEGVLAKSLIEELKELREHALKEEEPLLAKVTRLTYEYIEENEAFDIQALWEEDEEGGEYPLEIEDKDNLLIFFTSRRRHTRLTCDWSSDVCSSD